MHARDCRTIAKSIARDGYLGVEGCWVVEEGCHLNIRSFSRCAAVCCSLFGKGESAGVELGGPDERVSAQCAHELGVKISARPDPRSQSRRSHKSAELNRTACLDTSAFSQRGQNDDHDQARADGPRVPDGTAASSDGTIILSSLLHVPLSCSRRWQTHPHSTWPFLLKRGSNRGPGLGNPGEWSIAMDLTDVQGISFALNV